MINSSALLKIERVGVRVGTQYNTITGTIWQRLFWDILASF